MLEGSTKSTWSRFAQRTGLSIALAASPLVGAFPAVADPVFAPLETIAHDVTVLTRKSYNYAPAVIHDGGLYHLYWCAGVAGDYVLHAEAPDLRGPWHGADKQDYDQALAPSGSPDRFDGQHACDPNVLKVIGKFYLYYGGLPRADGGLTAIGVAVSDDAVHFARLDGGNPIVTAARTNPAWQKSKLTYGAGQPAAVFVAPYVYLSFSDSTGAGANPINGAGQFVLRSKDPSFAGGVQEFTGRGWADRPFGRHTAEHSILESFGIDWAYDSRHRYAGDGHRPGQPARRRCWRSSPAAFPHACHRLDADRLARRPGTGRAGRQERWPRVLFCGTMDIAVFAACRRLRGRPLQPGTRSEYSEETLAMGDLCRWAAHK